MKKILIVLFGLALFISVLPTISGEAITDQTSDVYHWHFNQGSYGWEEAVSNKPDIDITEISYSTGANQVTLTMKVAGTISNSKLISYWAYLNTSDSNYFISWNEGEGTGWAVSTEEGSYNMDFEPDITASGNTITGTFDNIGTFETGIEIWGWAAEYTTYNDMSSEWWGDWAPENYAMYDGEDTSETNGDDTDDEETNQDTNKEDETNQDQSKNTPPPSGTPGFEILAVFIAFIAIIFINKKRE